MNYEENQPLLDAIIIFIKPMDEELLKIFSDRPWSDISF